MAALHVMIGSISDYGHCADPELWRRYVRIMLDGLRAQPGPPSELERPALTEPELICVMSQWRC
jgi:hypothetical protein